MIKRFFLAAFLVILSLNADTYPKTFAQLGTPLYKSSKDLSCVLSTNKKLLEYEKFLERACENGLNADKTKDKKEIKSYLKELRLLQKKYDYLLHILHDEISKSIDAKDYEKFTLLTSYDFDGFLNNTNIRKKALTYYKKNSYKKHNKILDKKINNSRLIKATAQEFVDEIVSSSYDPNKKNKSKKSVSIFTRRVSNRIAIHFKNDNIYDVTIRVNAAYTNITTSKNTPKVFVLKAKTTQRYTTLKINNGKNSYSYSYSWIRGSKDAVHDDSYVYRLPYASGTSYRISQGYNGTATHKGRSQYAIDFAMPVGTKIFAVREGIVVQTKSNSNIGGYEKKFSAHGNHVTILHSDGTFATYYHLKHHGVLVKVGQRVNRGYPIGYSGNTGYTSGPHLHLSIFKAVSARTTHTIATRFVSQKGLINEVVRGESYIAK